MWKMLDRKYITKSMNVRVGKILRPELKIDYEYDFGTPTHLRLKVLSVEEKEVKYGRMILLARNEPPLRECCVCGKLAVYVCRKCIYESKGWLCDECASVHKCDKEMLTPIVNSPRVGICGYTGY
jgi:hypothetical protein